MAHYRAPLELVPQWNYNNFIQVGSTHPKITKCLVPPVRNVVSGTVANSGAVLICTPIGLLDPPTTPGAINEGMYRASFTAIAPDGESWAGTGIFCALSKRSDGLATGIDWVTVNTVELPTRYFVTGFCKVSGVTGQCVLFFEPLNPAAGINIVNDTSVTCTYSYSIHRFS